MSQILTLIAPPGSYRIDSGFVDQLRKRAKTAGFALADPVWLAPDEACDLALGAGDPAALGQWVEGQAANALIDFAVTEATGRRKKLLIADMDATMVVGETLDELAAHAGQGKQVAAVTARAMAGELDFKTALRARVATLEDLNGTVIDQVIDELQVTPGAATLVATMTAGGAKTMLVSGGFTQFTSHVAEILGFGATQANRLEIQNGKLTGRVLEPILDRDAKRTALRTLALSASLTEADAIAVGDGANDLAMIEAAGLGAAYRGKPILHAAADLNIDHGDLTALLYIQGYQRAEFVTV